MIDETGNRYGRLTVVKNTGELKHGRLLWLCKCACGSEKKIAGKNLRNGDAKSCGCLQREVSKRRYLQYRMYRNSNPLDAIDEDIL
jgi:hypothetical protein